jgi:hypothetical protein
MPGARANGVYINDLPYKNTGIKQSSPLAEIPMFDLVWDILPDMMHIMSGIWARHIFALLASKRQPAAVKSRKKNTSLENAVLQSEHAACCAKIIEWQLDQETKDAVDLRTRALAGTPTWIRANLEVCLHMCLHLSCAATASANTLLYLPQHLPPPFFFCCNVSLCSNICRHPSFSAATSAANISCSAATSAAFPCRNICRK